jgi:hypothetical protein
MKGAEILFLLLKVEKRDLKLKKFLGSRRGSHLSALRVWLYKDLFLKDQALARLGETPKGVKVKKSERLKRVKGQKV